MHRLLKYSALAALIMILSACGSSGANPGDANLTKTAEASIEVLPSETPVPSPTPVPPRVLTVCMGQEPTSLFLFADTTAAARGIRQAIYDGPLDIVNGEVKPVLLERVPSIENGDAHLRSVQVDPGELIMDARGNWVSLQAGVEYRPSGCTSEYCAQTYDGNGPVAMDELVVQFRMKPGILWSDGTPITTKDSVYSFNVAKDLYDDGVDILRFTKSYSAVDDHVVEWVGIPGYQGVYAKHFFSPLPQHLWGIMPSEDLLTSELATRTPLGWGPYVIDEWILGDHITLSRNPNYYRLKEGLPRFDNLVYRFIESGNEAMDAQLIGECDYVDQTALNYTQIPRLLEAQDEKKAVAHIWQSSSFEQAVFGIDPLDESRLSLFNNKKVRQAVAMCVERQAIVDELLFGVSTVPDGYLPSEHVLYNPEISHYDFDPKAAMDILASLGWADNDGDPNTPLTAMGVSGVPNETEFKFTYLVPDDPERQAVAEMVKESLEQCGIQVEIQVQGWETLLGSGPEGPVFGRAFDMAQFAWAESQVPACYLFLSEEIPGPYSDFPKSWGGGNPAGYSNPEFDQACRGALHTLPDTEEYHQYHDQAQAIFAEDIPVLPLYWRLKLAAMRPDICQVNSADLPIYDLRALEFLDYGEGCD